MSNVYIENKGVFALESVLNETKKIIPMINNNDKTPLWDGELFIYNSEKMTKENLIYTVPVQVKARTVDHYNNYILVPYNDIAKYEIKDGLIYFSIQFNRDKYNIYYALLTKFDLKKLQSKNSNKKNCKITLTMLPKDDYAKIYEICKDAARKCKRNSKMLDNVSSLQEAMIKYPNGKIKCDISINNNVSKLELIKEINEQKPYVYISPNDMTNEFVVDKINEELQICLVEDNIFDVYVNEEHFFCGTRHIFLPNKTVCSFGNYIDISLEGKIINYTYRLSGSLADRIKTIKFTINVLEGNDICIGTKSVKLGDFIKDDNELAKLRNSLIVYEKIKKCLDYLGVSVELDIDKLTKQDVDELLLLYDSLFNETMIKYDYNESGHNSFMVAGIKLLLWADVIGNNQAKVYNYFAYNKKLRLKSTNEEVSNYLIIADTFPMSNYLNLFDNINYDDMVEEITSKVYDESYFHLVNNLILALVSYYDETKNNRALMSAKKICEYLIKEYPQIDLNIGRLNLFQIKKRLNQLTEEDKKELVIIKDGSMQYEIKFACATILKQIADSKYYFDLIDEGIKENLIKMPIYSLYLEMNK